MLTFITGPVRSGKSALAQRLALRSGRGIVFCATAALDVDDEEWSARIARHQAERPSDWTTIETAVPGGKDLVTALDGAQANQIVVVDSIGTWLADVMGRHPLGTSVVEWHDQIEAHASRLTSTLEQCAADVIVISEEAGWGVVPVHVSGRVFRDVLGRTNQRLCAMANDAFLVVAGAAIDLKKT
ncbi:MAG TPA: bifunctional adenosylcobinamide kinase/adenosylcobinamide-phosphate guanylyltransferase [Candidatus Baltobacteraceae bacterium]